MILLVNVLSILICGVYAGKNGKLEDPKITLMVKKCELDSKPNNAEECTSIYYLCTQMPSQKLMLKFSCPTYCCFDTNILKCICEEEIRRIPAGRKFAINSPTTSATASRPPDMGEFQCPQDNGNGYLNEYPDPNDCQYFWICYSEDLMVRYDCNGDWYFNGEECDQGECPNRIPGARPLDPKPTECPMVKFACPDLNYGSRHPDPNDCNFYFTCEFGYILRRDQCDDGEHFEGGECVEGSCPNSVRDCEGTTEIPTTTTVATTTTSTPPKTDEFQCPHYDGNGDTDEYADPNNCQYFWICYSKDIMVRLKCGDDQHFNGDMCVPGRCPGKIPGAKPLKPKDPGCKVEKFECPNKKYGGHPDPNDCHFYFRCQNGSIVRRRECPKGEHFDDKLKYCVKGKCSSTIRDKCGI